MPTLLKISNAVPRNVEAALLVEAYMRELDVFLMDELTVHVGFDPGTYTLANRGIYRVGHLIALDRGDLLRLPGFGTRRVQRIETYLDARGLRLANPCRAWTQHNAAAERKCLNSGEHIAFEQA